MDWDRLTRVDGIECNDKTEQLLKMIIGLKDDLEIHMENMRLSINVPCKDEL